MPDPIYDAAQSRQMDYDDYLEARATREPVDFEREKTVEAKHTPGPWEAYFGAGAGWSVRKEHERPGYEGKAPVCSMAWWQFDIPGIIDDGISEANARLIAAAPDLLAALKAILSSPTYGNEPSDEAIKMVEAAIAKAEGTAQ